MPAKMNEQKESFWQRYKLYIIGMIGAILLVSFFNVNTIIITYETPDGTNYAAKLDYSAFDMCLNCMGTNEISSEIVEKELFFGAGKKDTVSRAASALQEIAGTDDGTVSIMIQGIVGAGKKKTAEMVAYLEDLGYTAKALELKK
ncbi:MAG: hypothetical protein IJN34_05400 [Clostridia bacterium]|nr:hypothetical protein [Clostridia bacterium]